MWLNCYKQLQNRVWVFITFLYNSLSLDRRVGNYTRFQFYRLLVPGPKTHNFSLVLAMKSLTDPFLILRKVTSPIFVDPFPVVFTVLSSVISDVLLVLLTISSLAAGESFLVVFIPSFTTMFENLDVLCTISFFLGQDSLSALCIIFFMVGLFTDSPLVMP